MGIQCSVSLTHAFERTYLSGLLDDSLVLCAGAFRIPSATTSSRTSSADTAWSSFAAHIKWSKTDTSSKPIGNWLPSSRRQTIAESLITPEPLWSCQETWCVRLKSFAPCPIRQGSREKRSRCVYVKVWVCVCVWKLEGRLLYALPALIFHSFLSRIFFFCVLSFPGNALYVSRTAEEGREGKGRKKKE